MSNNNAMNRPQISDIVQSVRDKWLKWGDAINNINSGNCDLFAWDVIETAADYGIYCEEMDTAYMDNVPENLSGHVWVYCKDDGKHYDVETPQGVSDWMQLPYFQREIMKNKLRIMQEYQERSMIEDKEEYKDYIEGKVYSSNDIVSYIRRIAKHHYNDEETDMEDRISNSNYILKNIPVSSINIEWNVDEDYVEDWMEFYERQKFLPPIVLSETGSIVDGTHRLQALIELGLEKVMTFVPVNSDIGMKITKESKDVRSDVNKFVEKKKREGVFVGVVRNSDGYIVSYYDKRYNVKEKIFLVEGRSDYPYFNRERKRRGISHNYMDIFLYDRRQNKVIPGLSVTTPPEEAEEESEEGGTLTDLTESLNVSNIRDFTISALEDGSWRDAYDCLYPENEDDDRDCYFESKQDYESYIDDVVLFFEDLPDEFYVYRSIYANSKEGVDVEFPGEFWTINARTALNFGSHSRGNFIMRGWVRKEDVDLEQSIRAYVEFSDLVNYDSEFEITIPNADTVVHDIEVFTNKEAKQMSENEEFVQPRHASKIVESLDLKETFLLEGSVDEGFLYHGTTSNHIEDILKYGMKSPSWWGSYEIAREYALNTLDAERGFGAPLIIKKKIDDFDKSAFAIDAPSIQEPLTLTLGKSEEEVWEEWENSDQTWEDCLDIVESVKYTKKVDIDRNEVEHV